MVVYGHRIVMDTQTPDGPADKVIRVGERREIDPSGYPVSLVYQNNQDRQISLVTDREFSNPESGQMWIFHVEDVVSFQWETGSDEIGYRKLALVTDDIFRFWLYHVVLPIYFSITQTYKFLHAGAVEIDGDPVLFMAPSFGGKSTLTDYFIRRGHPLITDDKMATFERGGDYFSVPSHPFHRPFRTVEVLGYRCDNAATEAKPIGAIYILEKSEPDADITIRRLKGIEKFSRLHEGGEMNFSFFSAGYVRYLAALSGRVPVCAITVPHDLERLTQVYDAIVEYTRTLKG